MNIVADAGNTVITVGIFEQEDLLASWEWKTDRGRTADEYGVMLHQMMSFYSIPSDEIEGALICSVVPDMDSLLQQMLEQYVQVPVHFVGPGVKTGLNILYENPREVGADRITNAVAGKALYGAPLIIVDFGTAVTFCYLDEEGRYLGGAIMPGLDLAMEALAEKASRLPKVRAEASPRVIGRSTAEALQSGYRYGGLGAVEGIISRIRRESGTNAAVVAAGPPADWAAAESRLIDQADPLLTLKGLQFIYEKNSGLFR
ncbi:type III pantothenate kinase [Alkalicoccus luteus]|uniref:Type III pantothenate kinase n=1 Tax=Alkalicoccus luteus TaxID=1237094 RepID=A0A969PWU1_9BACI|nr:type III pantothenate kinase [Alkalicoccus luteus]NJP39333.1 type III pantothenate kinase [Alkalicoccus luteus]